MLCRALRDPHELWVVRLGQTQRCVLDLLDFTALALPLELRLLLAPQRSVLKSPRTQICDHPCTAPSLDL
jgi:hypothetical protein